MTPPPRFWADVALGVALLLAAAKTHGRQLRLERELEGHFEVQFGRGPNHPWVEALWRRDRVRFWTAYPAAAAAATLAVLWGARTGHPLFQVGDWTAPTAAAAALAGFLWAPSAAFALNGFLSLRRFRRALAAPAPGGPRHDEVRRQRAAWLAEARRGTLVWWGLLGVLAAAAVAAFS